jgi:hypothetical protein
MKAQATVEGIDHVLRSKFGGLYERPEQSAIAPPLDDVVTAESVSVAGQIRIEPVRWSVIIAGSFAALATLGLLGLLASALALPPFPPNSLRAEPVSAVVAGVVAVVVSVLAFGIGGWVASRLSVLHTMRTALLCGALVWAVCTPIVSSGVVAARVLMAEAQPPALMLPRSSVTALAPGVDRETERVLLGDRLQTHACVGFFALVLGLGASLVGGMIGTAGRRNTTKIRRLHDALGPNS